MRARPLRYPPLPGVAFGAVLFSTLVLTALAMPSHATEEPQYQVVRELADIELRQYVAYAVAEVVVPGPAGEAGNQPFPILAGYIFGKNKGERKFAMTAPVTQVAVPVKLEMTAPVTQTAAAGGCLVQFVLPKGVTVASAPHEAACRTALSEGFFFSNRAVLCDGLSARAFAGCVVRRWAAIGRQKRQAAAS